VTARDEEEIAGPDALFACLILIQIGAFDDHDEMLVSCMPASIRDRT
jgi:hypothetical protein